MGAFRPTNYTKKERAALSKNKLKTLRKAIIGQHEKHKGIRKIVRQETRQLYNRLKKG